MSAIKNRMRRAAAIVRDAGRRVVGRTRMQKIAYLLELAGAGEGYSFRYRYYGPYSEELSEDLRTAWAFDLIEEREEVAAWGGLYSIYTLIGDVGEEDSDRAEFAHLAAGTDAVALELAATAAYLRVEEGYDDPWKETASRKPEKATPERLAAAKEFYSRLRQTKIGLRLPSLG